VQILNNHHLFELINAPAALGAIPLLLATALAQWLICLIPVAMAIAWLRGDHGSRRELLQMLLAALLALAIGQILAFVAPQPRPFQLHLGHQYLAHSADPGLPSDHVTVFWSLALAALVSIHYATWGFPLLALGLAVGWSRVYLGVHFPYDVAAALPVACLGVAAARLARRPLLPAVAHILHSYDRRAGQWRGWFRSTRES
jgi:undecaprenyl-diphosphatase